MSLASIQRVVSVEKHSNADSLDLAKVLEYVCIVKRDEWKVGDLCVFIEPDSVLPDLPWAAFYKAKSSRVRAIKLRGETSFGVIESFAKVGYTGPIEEGLDITEALGVTKYEAPQPQDLNASGVYGWGIPRTDEEKWNGIRNMPWGELCDVTLKIDGQSWSGLWTVQDDVEHRGVGGRSFLYRDDSDNNYTQNQANYDVLNKLSAYCRQELAGKGLCLRGEQYGRGIQKSTPNPHSKLPLSLAFYSTWLIDERRYARKGHPLYIFDLAPKLGLPTVPMLEQNVVLTRELVNKYQRDLQLVNGQPFEGVVVNWSGGSFKIINLDYDSKK